MPSTRPTRAPRGLMAALLMTTLTLAPGPTSAQETRDEAARGEQPAPPRAEQREEVSFLLTAHHELPSKQLFDRASPDARGVLFELAQDPRLFPLHRYRALEALGAYWPDDEVFKLYAGILGRNDDELATHRVLLFASLAFRDRALPLIEPYLGHDDLQMRMTAVEATIRVDSDASRALLDARAETETDARLRLRMIRATGTLH